MHSFVDIFADNYASGWKGVIADALGWTFVYYFIGAVTFFIFTQMRANRFSPRALSALSLRELVRYVICPDIQFSPTGRTDKIIYAAETLAGPVWAALQAAATVFIASNLQAGVATHFGPASSKSGNGEWTQVVQAILSFCILDFATYAVHWLEHNWSVLWAFHRVHHSAEELTPFTADRNHVVEDIYVALTEGFIAGVLTGPLLYFTGGKLFPLTFPLFVAWAAIRKTLGVLGHSHIPISFGRMNVFIPAPIMHHIHHSAELEHFGKNIGVMSHIWDWVCGSLYLPEPFEEGGKTFRLGLGAESMGVKNPHNHLRGYLLEPFAYAWHAFAKRSRASNLIRNNRR